MYQPSRVTVRQLVMRAAEISGFTATEIMSPCRTDALAQVRFAIMLLARRSGVSFPQIGRCLGGRDHTTILHGVRRAELLLGSPEFADFYAALSEEQAVAA